MAGYGQFCPIAKTMELLDERWTVLIVRELLAGSHRWGEIRRGVPRMSPALLSKRLHTLERAGIVERTADAHGVRYTLTPGGRELEPVVLALGRWGVRWRSRLGDADLDPHLLMWDIHRRLDLAALPPGRTVIAFEFTDVAARTARWWVVADPALRDEPVDLCDVDPGFETAVRVRGTLADLTLLWRGDLAWGAALKEERIALAGSPAARRALPRWLLLSQFAAAPRPGGA